MIPDSSPYASYGIDCPEAAVLVKLIADFKALRDFDGVPVRQYIA